MNIENKVKVTICGKEYNLRTDESPEYIKNLAVRTEKEINDLVKQKPNFGIQNAAVFVALTSLDEAAKAAAGVENIRSQIKTYMNEAAKARSAKEKLSARVKELEEKIAELEKENKELKKRPPLYDCEQLVLENTITPAVTIYAEENAVPVTAEEPVPEEKKTEEAAAAPEAPDEKPAQTENNENNNEPLSADNGECASCGEEKNGQEEKGEVADRGSEGNAEAESNGGDTQSDNVTLQQDKPNGRQNRNRKKKR